MVCKGWCVVHTGPCKWDRECTMVSSWAAISHCHQQELCVLLPRAEGLLMPPKYHGIPWWHQPVPTATSPGTQFREESHRSHRPWLWSWLQNTHLLALEKRVGIKYLGQMKGESIAGIPGLQNHDSSRAGAGQGLQVPRGARQV